MSAGGRRGAGWLTAMALIAGAACSREDGGLRKYEQASEQYRTLLAKGRPASDPAFDRVLELLEGVPPRSSVHDRAEVLRQALLNARRRLPSPPLIGHGAGAAADPPAAALRSRCEELVRQLGTAAPEVRPQVTRALVECQRAAHAHDVHGHDYTP